MRILHVNNQASVGFLLSRAQRELGHRSDLLALPDPKQRRPDFTANSVAGELIELLRKAPKYDLIHVHGGIGASGFALLPYKAAGKRFFAHYHGSELRKGIQTSFHRIAERIFISTPDLKRFSKNVGGRELVHIPNPVFLEGVEPVDWEGKMRELEEGAPLRIAHLPSIRSVKGTDNVIGAVERAKKRGADLKLDIVEDIHLDRAMKRLGRAHACIDWMSNEYDIHGVVSIEAMVRGIPTICNIDRSLYPPEIPIIDSTPKGLPDALVSLSKGMERLPAIGRRSRKYALKYHDPMKVAALIERFL